MISASAVWCRWRALECEVPLKEVGFERSGVEGWVGVSLQLGGFFEDAFYGGGFGVECWERHGG